MKMPIRPNDNKPPTTPAKISSSGRSAPMRISMGRSTLSIVPTTSMMISSTVAQTLSPIQ